MIRRETKHEAREKLQDAGHAADAIMSLGTLLKWVIGGLVTMLLFAGTMGLRYEQHQSHEREQDAKHEAAGKAIEDLQKETKDLGKWQSGVDQQLKNISEGIRELKDLVRERR